MANVAADKKLSLRVTPDVLKRADALRAKVARDAKVIPLGKVTQSTIMKLALIEGLAVLEQRYKP